MNYKKEKMNQSRKYIISTVIVLMTVLAASFGQKVMTLEECRHQAVEFNKELKNAALKKKEAVANQEVARTAYLPTVSGSMSLTHMQGLGDLSIPGHFLQTAASAEAANAGEFLGESNVWSPGFSLGIDNLTLINSAVSVTQAIYAGGKIRYSNQQADAGVEISSLAFNLSYSEVLENTDQAFWNVAMVESNIQIAEEYIKMLTELEEQMASTYEVGLTPASEKLRVSVKKNQATLDLLKANNALRISKMYLNQILGQELATDIKINYDAKSDVQLLNMQTGRVEAGAQRNELKILAKQKEISELNLKIERADYLPTLGVSAQYSNYWVKDLNEEVDFQPMIGAQLSIPIFKWGQGKKKQRAAQLRVEQAQITLENTNDLINLEVMQVQIQVEEAYESIAIAKQNIAEATESLAETKASFDVGLNTTTDLLNAQAQWQEAQSQLIQTVAQFKVLETRWKKVTGNLYLADG